MVDLEGLGRFPAEVAAGYFRSETKPLDNCVADFLRDHFGFTFRAAHAQAGGADAAMELVAVKPFALSFAITFDDVNITHLLDSSMRERTDSGNMFNVDVKP